MPKKSFDAAAIDIVTIEEDATGVRVVAATDQQLSVDLHGKHFDDPASAQAIISSMTGRPVRLHDTANKPLSFP